LTRVLLGRGLFHEVKGECVNDLWKFAAILILAKSYSTARNRGMVMPSERAKRARAVERAGFI
jgi:hypothetical protein